VRKALSIVLLTALATAFPCVSVQAARTAQCFATLHDGLRGTGPVRTRGTFVFDSGWAFESYDYVGEDGGGQGLYRQRGKSWCVVTRGGGALGEGGLVSAGVPKAVAHRLVQKLNAKLK
jgi:hypothetical protein